jgi:perosamine synthetase
MEFIPVNEPLLNGNEKQYLIECIDTGWISSEGPFVDRFEREFAASVSRSHGIAVANGTAAIDTAIEVLGFAPGDEIILPTFTIISCINHMIRKGIVPVLVDSDPITWNMDVSQVEAKITPRTRAIMVVHIYGLPVDLDPVMDIAHRYGLKVIEDAAEMHGQTYRGQPCGSFGDLSVFSFYPNKHITTGEGGMIVTNDDHLAAECRGLRNLCFQPQKRFNHQRLGWNFRMTNMQAAVGVAQLERFPEHIRRKRNMGATYQTGLAEVPGLQLPLPETAYAQNIYWVFGLILESQVSFDAEEAMTRLSKMGVGTRPFFWPMHEQPVLRSMSLFHGERYPVAENMARRGFYIPSGLGLTTNQQEAVIAGMRELMES